MKIHCDLHLGDQLQKIYLVPRPEEKDDHIALKLAGLVMFHRANPIVEPSSDHPSLNGFTHRPDLCVLDEGGGMSIWIECGNVSLNKLDKVLRRFSYGRVVVIKPDLREAGKLRKDLAEAVKNSERIEIWAWSEKEFDGWFKAIAEKTEVFGEAEERNFNLVINETPYVAELLSI
jgi:hypothetical protein